MIIISTTNQPTTIGTERLVRISPDGPQGAKLAVTLNGPSQGEELSRILRTNTDSQSILAALAAAGISCVDGSSI